IDKASSRVKERLTVLTGKSQTLLKAADAALLASGTSAVEGTILGCPMVVAYKVSPLSWFLAKRLVKLPYVSIANLLVGREIIPELLQDRCRPEEMAQALLPLFGDTAERRQMEASLKEAAELFGEPGASAKVLDIILDEIGATHVRP
ncbi:MAG: lipid-A-disaccharide synthase, partial [Deltaproteobacteria bacterium]|nr:lipid-A-disaccharide synthase [Deltaproteobacteria bacterium]